MDREGQGASKESIETVRQMVHVTVASVTLGPGD